jgi:glycerol-3-phosphate dehydrogenase
MIDKEELEQLTGYKAGIAALWSGMTGIFDPFQYTIALAEAAASQGVQYHFGRMVTGITALGDTEQTYSRTGFRVVAKNLGTGLDETYQAGILINSAGLYADEICRMAGIDDFTVFPCRGEYHILDRRQSGLLELPIYPIPNENEGGLGVHLTPTTHGNIMIGPSAEYLEEGLDREDYSTTQDVMERLSQQGVALFPKLDVKDCIRSFSGMRPKLVSEEKGGYADFVIDESKRVPGFIQLVGIESPGLTSSIPIARMVVELIEKIRERSEDAETAQEKVKLKADEMAAGSQITHGSYRDPGDKKMLCRCEGITEEAVLSAYDRILDIGAVPTIKGLKNRSRATMGSCQGSFCTINIIELLQNKRSVDPLTLLWSGFESQMFNGRVKE